MYTKAAKDDSGCIFLSKNYRRLQFQLQITKGPIRFGGVTGYYAFLLFLDPEEGSNPAGQLLTLPGLHLPIKSYCEYEETRHAIKSTRSEIKPLLK